MKKIASVLLGGVGLICTSLHFGCQDPTLVTTRAPSSSGTVRGMLYYLPMGKITIQGDYTTSEQTPTPTATVSVTPTPTPTPCVALNKKKDGNDTDSGKESALFPVVSLRLLSRRMWKQINLPVRFTRNRSLTTYLTMKCG